MDKYLDILRQHPELTIFLTLACGFALGYVRIGKFKLGPVLGTLFAGVVIGQVNVDISPVVKIVFFDLFLFATGYKVGPQFFRGLKKDALPQLALTAVICVGCLLTAFLLSKLLGFDTGTAAGLLAGAFTESTVIGTASEAINRLDIPADQKVQMINNIPVAYAVTYLVGTTTLVWFLSSVAPWLMKINLREESRKLTKKLTGTVDENTGENSAFQEWTMRAFRITGEKWAGKRVRDLESNKPETKILIQRIRHEGMLLMPEPGTVVGEGDTVAVMARPAVMLEHLSGIGPEVADRELLDFPIAFRDIIVTRRSAMNRNLRDVGLEYGQGVMLHKMIRGGQEIPFDISTQLNRGDVLKVSGRLPDLERAAKGVGYLEKVSPVSDMIFIGLGIFLGGLIGLLAVRFGSVELTLTASGGALFMGLVFGWVHSRTPKVGRIPEAALWVFDNVGLAAFIGIVGLAAGPSFVSGLKQTGISILFAGLGVALVPHILGLLFGRFVLKMNPVILLGAHSGAGTTTTALKAIQDAAGSKLPALGYTVPYALGNILLTAWGPVIVAMMS